ncbi:MAG: type II secretion system F family protein [Roseburia sp.]|nr:type II secretion system F family protein [Roseburia sp.]
MIGIGTFLLAIIVFAKAGGKKTGKAIRAPCVIIVLCSLSAAGAELVNRDVEQELKILVCGVLAAIALWYIKREQGIREQEKVKKRMLLEYPEFVNKLSLLLGAGMTVLAAFTRMDQMYGKLPEGRREKLHPAYAALHQMLIDIENGKSLQRAFQSFGEVCRLQPYRKLVSLLLSCQQMGNRKLMERLNEEADRVFSERKHLARKLGEEAGTKMLFPMMLMMLLVMGIILVPAMLSLNI